MFPSHDHVVVGGAMAVTPAEKVLLGITANRLYTLRSTDANWVIDTSGLGNSGLVDTTFIETASEYVGIIADGNTALRKWTASSGVTSITPVSGAIPSAISVCTVARKILALVDPHTLRWSNTLTYDDWPNANFNKIAQTNDIGIAVVPLSNLTFVVYKERSLYRGRAVSGPPSAAFAISEPLVIEGPAGLHAIVNAAGTHFYMTKSGRIAVFDGTSYPCGS